MSDDGIKSELKYLNEKMDLYHKTVMHIVNPLKNDLKKTNHDVITLKRDRYWVFTFCITAFGSAVYAVIDKIIK